MTITINDLNLIKDKKYTEFSTKIKSELHNKLRNIPVCVSYNSELEKISTIKKSFKNINDTWEDK